MYLQNTTFMRCLSRSRVLLSAALIAGLLVSTGCSSRPPVEVILGGTQIKQPNLRPALPNPQAVSLSPFKWKVITKKRLPKGDRWVYYAITPREYEVLARNMAELLRWVKEAKWRLDYYRGKGQVDGNGAGKNAGGNRPN